MIGTTVSHYLIESEIGRGGMGIVYKATDTRLDRTVALKFLPSTHHSDDDAEARFVHEAKSISALDHPNIAVVYEIGETEKKELFIAMGYYTGDTLAEHIASRQLSNEEVADYTRQIAAGLQCAHEKGIIHRDVKPGNAIVTESGLLKILDFGLAKVHDVTLTADNLSVGTPAYLSPEQSTGKPFDHRVDLWALGVVMFEMLTGDRPFVGTYPSEVAYGIVNNDPPDVQELRPDVSEELLVILDRLLQKDPDDRYASAGDVVAALGGDSDGRVPVPTRIDTVSAADGSASKMTGLSSITNMLNRDTITRTVVEVVPKKVFGVAARLFYSVAVSLIAVVIGYFFQQRFLENRASNAGVATVITEDARAEARQHARSGIDYLADQDYSLAVAELEQAISLDSTYSAAWSSLSAAHLQLNNFAEAADAATKAVVLDRENDGAYYNLGFALSELGKVDEAISAFERATEITPSFTRAFSAWGDMLIEEGRPDEALRVLADASLTAEPQYAFLIFKNIGKAHFVLEQYEDAITYLESAHEREDRWPETSWLLAQSYEAQGRRDDARSMYEHYVSIENNPAFKKRARDRITEL